MRRLGVSFVFGTAALPLRWASTVASDHYARLGVPHDASQADIKAAYRRKALTCHPDVVPDTEKTQAEVEFRRVSESYAILGDPKDRAKYNSSMGISGQKTAPRPQSQAAKKREPGSDTSMSRPERERKGQSTPTPRARSSKKKARPFVRRQADEAFKAAFDGKTLDEILFRTRFDARHGNSSNSAGQRAEETVQRTQNLAAERLAKNLRVKYGPEALRKIKVQATPQKAAPPPQSQMPFRPFPHMLDQGIPDGVTVPQDPTLEAVGVVSSETPVERIEEVPDVDVNSSPDFDYRATDMRDPTSFQRKAARLREIHQAQADNEGQLYSYQRPY